MSKTDKDLVELLRKEVPKLKSEDCMKIVGIVMEERLQAYMDGVENTINQFYNKKSDEN